MTWDRIELKLNFGAINRKLKNIHQNCRKTNSLLRQNDFHFKF